MPGRDYTNQYRRFVTETTNIAANQMVKSTFYQVKQYLTVDGVMESYSAATAPIIFTIFVSKAKDIVHCIKLGEINPSILKRLMAKLSNEKSGLIELKGGAKRTYSEKISSFSGIKENAYRTYKLSGLKKVSELEMYLPGFTTTRDHITGINSKYQKQNV
jgi:hypothetical protein